MSEIKSVFDWVKQIAVEKKSWDSFTDEEHKVWNNYMVIKCFSMNPDYIELVNILAGFYSWEPEMLYKCLCDMIPKGPYYFKYIKTTNPKPNDEVLTYLSQYFQLSKREMKRYVKILNKKDQIEILERLGVSQEEVKKLTKTIK